MKTRARARALEVVHRRVKSFLSRVEASEMSLRSPFGVSGVANSQNTVAELVRSRFEVGVLRRVFLSVGLFRLGFSIDLSGLIVGI